MNAGVSTAPCASPRRPRRAFAEVERILKSRSAPLDQHGVAVREEAVALVDRVPVGLEDVLLAGEGADEHEKGRFWQMKIGQQPVDDLEFVAWIYEEIGFPFEGLFLGHGLQGPQARG